MRMAIVFFGHVKDSFSCPFLKFPKCAYPVLRTLRITCKEGKENAGTQNAQIILFPKSNNGNFIFLFLVLFYLRELCSVPFLPLPPNKLNFFYPLFSHLYIPITYSLSQT